MDMQTIIGLALVAAGFADCLVAMTVLGPRIPDEEKRRIVVGAVLSGGLIMMLLGGAIGFGVIPIGE